jgi:hypothetical protein
MLPSEIAKSGPYSGDGRKTEFSYKFPIRDPRHLIVVETTQANDGSYIERVVPMGVDHGYDVIGVGDPDGGYILYPISTKKRNQDGSYATHAPITSKRIITLIRRPPFLQEVDLSVVAGWRPGTVERMVDNVVEQTQYLLDQYDRTLKVPLGSNIDPDKMRDDLLRAVADAAKAALAAAKAQASAEKARDQSQTWRDQSKAYATQAQDTLDDLNKDAAAHLKDMATVVKDFNALSSSERQALSQLGNSLTSKIITEGDHYIAILNQLIKDLHKDLAKAENLGRYMEIFLGAYQLPPSSAPAGPLLPGMIYFDLTKNAAQVYDGAAWRPLYSASPSLQSKLIYDTKTPQKVYPLTAKDARGNSYTLNANYLEGVNAYINGVRMVEDIDYTVDRTTSEVTFSQKVPHGAVVQFDILTPPELLQPGAINVKPIADLDINWTGQPQNSLAGTVLPGAAGMVDGRRTEFELHIGLMTGTTQQVTTINPVEVEMFVDGVRQHPGKDYVFQNGLLHFTEAPQEDASVWGVWLQPAAAAGGGAGGTVWPPDTFDLGIAAGDPNGQYFWLDGAGLMRIVADAAEMNNLPAGQLEQGSMAFNIAAQQWYVFDGTSTWTEFLPMPPTGAAAQPHLMSLTYDPSLAAGEQVKWEDFRDRMETVDNQSDLIDTTILPVSHLRTGKLVYVRTEGSIYEFIADTNSMAGDMTDWRPLVSGVTYVARWGDLPTVGVDGQLFVVKMTFAGDSLYRLVGWAATGNEMANVLINGNFPISSTSPQGAVVVFVGGATVLSNGYVDIDLTVDGTVHSYHVAVNAGDTPRAVASRAFSMIGPSLSSQLNLQIVGDAIEITTTAGHTLDGITATPSSSGAGVWRPLNHESWIKDARADPDHATDQMEGDVQYTVEQDHPEVKVFANGAWRTVFSEDSVLGWIAASSRFEGTVAEDGAAVIGTVELSSLPDIEALQLASDLSKTGHYWVFQGTPSYTIPAAGDPAAVPHGISRDLGTAQLQIGDWLQISNRGGDGSGQGANGAPIDLRWVRIGGDLLTKGRWDSLALQPYQQNQAAEAGALRVLRGDVYQAPQDILRGDPEPGQTGSPWQKLDISGGLKIAASDQQLPATAPPGQVWIVLQSGMNAGDQTLYAYDAAAQKWKQLGGSGKPLALAQGKELINVGMPIASVIAYAGQHIPPGWLLCDGSAFDPLVYKDLNALLGRARVPDLRNQFIMGGSTTDPFTHHAQSTARPHNAFTGITNTDSGHTHNQNTAGHAYNHSHGHGNDPSGFGGSHSLSTNTSAIQTGGRHSHSVTITGGGDAKTRPDHVVLAYIIKASDECVAERTI